MVVALDHVHLIVSDPDAAAKWFAEMLGGDIVGRVTVFGSPQAYIRFGGGLVIVRALRQGERLTPRAGGRHSLDHFGVRVDSDLDGFCERLRQKGVRFLLDPVEINEATRVAFVEGPDAISIEITERREWPELTTLGADPSRIHSTPP